MIHRVDAGGFGYAELRIGKFCADAAESVPDCPVCGLGRGLLPGIFRRGEHNHPAAVRAQDLGTLVRFQEGIDRRDGQDSTQGFGLRPQILRASPRLSPSMLRNCNRLNVSQVIIMRLSKCVPIQVPDRLPDRVPNCPINLVPN